MKRTFTLLLALLMLVSFAVPALAAEPELSEEERQARMGGTLILREMGDPMSWCPSAAADDNAYAMYQNMFNRLTKLDAAKSRLGRCTRDHLQPETEHDLVGWRTARR